MFLRVRDGLRDDVIRSRFEGRREAVCGEVAAHADRQIRSAGELLERTAEPVLGEHRWMDAVRDLTQLLDRLGEFVSGCLHHAPCLSEVVLVLRSGESKCERNETLLR